MANVSLSSIKGSPGDRPPVSVNNGRVFSGSSNLSGVENFAQQSLSGALTAATYKDVLTLTAPGVIKFAGIRTEDATSRTITIKLTIDGAVALEQSLTTAISLRGIYAIGQMASVSTGLTIERIPFNTLTVSLKSSLTETDKLSAFYTYDLVT